MECLRGAETVTYLHNRAADGQENGTTATHGSHEIDRILDTYRLIILVVVEPGEDHEGLTAGVAEKCCGSGNRSQHTLSRRVKGDEPFSSLGLRGKMCG